jgi:hypothetical protein
MGLLAPFLFEFKIWQPVGLKESKREFGFTRTDFADFAGQ